LVRLLGHGWVLLGAFRRLEDKVFRLGLGLLELHDVSVELAHILPDERIAFAFLHRD
jgi:hypothetical protein